MKISQILPGAAAAFSAVTAAGAVVSAYLNPFSEMNATLPWRMAEHLLVGLGTAAGGTVGLTSGLLGGTLFVISSLNSCRPFGFKAHTLIAGAAGVYFGSIYCGASGGFRITSRALTSPHQIYTSLACPVKTAASAAPTLPLPSHHA